MFRAVTFLTLLEMSLVQNSGSIYQCVPNTQFIANGRYCTCDSLGQWSEATCLVPPRRASCQPGQVVRQGCSQCVCQNNGQLTCSTQGCSITSTTSVDFLRQGLSIVGPLCTPYRSYYVDCSICVCPASGLTAKAQCSKDISCSFNKPSNADFLVTINKNMCLPKVMYLFPCLHCLCSDDGFFTSDKCTDVCESKTTLAPKRCIPDTFYRLDCNICFCPKHGISDQNFCNKMVCSTPSKFQSLENLRKTSARCIPHSFVKPKCYYCDCTQNGKINETFCIEMECAKAANIDYTLPRSTCKPGELVPLCSECYCFPDGFTNSSYCSRACSHQSKFKILKKVLALVVTKPEIINTTNIQKKGTNNGLCIPNTHYMDKNLHCLCPDNGNANFKLCSSIIMPSTSSRLQRKITTKQKKVKDQGKVREQMKIKEQEKVKNRLNDKVQVGHVKIDFNATCEPKTFVTFDCNTCFCSKKGRIDPKWCTYDDCEVKRRVQESHRNTKSNVTQTIAPPAVNSYCTPGTLSEIDCNFCICPNSGKTTELACTKNHCSGNDRYRANDNFSCEPFAYYEVDCNICLCPRDGLKNVAKCTKNLCEKNFLRTDVCVPGQLFSDQCNVCICPPNGDKTDKVCTNNTCPDGAGAWKKIFKVSETFLENQVTGDDENIKNLGLCFAGEQFIEGCKLCVCPEMGLRAYATCTSMMCDEDNRRDSDIKSPHTSTGDTNGLRETLHADRRSLRDGVVLGDGNDDDPDRIGCLMIDIGHEPERKECTPGSMYIIRCRQCFCPYKGNINHFCRPLPPKMYCEQAYPGYNFKSMGRRIDGNGTPDINVTAENATIATNETESPAQTNRTIVIHNKHTKFSCPYPGHVMDSCFICDCDEDEHVIIEEHCFKSDHDDCKEARPTFLNQSIQGFGV